MTKPWEVADQIRHADQIDKQKSILSILESTDPFWIGSSYALDPFVGIICHLPIFDPKQYGSGVPPSIFDKLVKGILDGTLKGDSLVMGVETFSKHCTEQEWSLWYRPILQGEMNLRVPLSIFNEFCPDGLKIPPPKLSNPRPIQSLKELPNRFFLQPYYDTDRVFWLIDSKNIPHEIRAYDSKICRFQNSKIGSMFRAFSQFKTVDIVVMGYPTNEIFLADDILSREQFTQEMGAFTLQQRLEGLSKLGLPSVQMSDICTPSQPELFLKELSLLFQQGYRGAIIRNLDAHYPFRNQSDFLIHPTVNAVAVVKEYIPGVGLSFEYTRGKKIYTGIVRIGLTKDCLGDISELSGKRFNLISCGAKGDELLFPVFKSWSIK
jgi:hypothetical protein